MQLNRQFNALLESYRKSCSNIVEVVVRVCYSIYLQGALVHAFNAKAFQKTFC